MKIADTNLCELLRLRLRFQLGTDAETLYALGNSAWAQTFQILKDPLGRPVGYIAWANLNSESVQRLQQDFRLPKYVYEWNEGKIAVILDVIYNHESRFGLRALIRDLFPRSRLVVLWRRKHLSIYVRRHQRYSLASKKLSPTGS
jgi:hemolysin-activating ACP:hemolysin acyltransferase